MWEDWREHRQKLATTPPPLLTITESEISYWMTHFILKVRKKNGAPYLPNTLHHTIAALMQHYIKQDGRAIDFFKDAVMPVVLAPCQIEVLAREHSYTTLRTSWKTIREVVKVVFHHEKVENKECFATLFKHYRSLCPSDAPDYRENWSSQSGWGSLL